MANLYTSQTPTTPANLEGSPLTLAQTFYADVAGSVTGGRFYASSAAASGTFEAVLWLPTVSDRDGSVASSGTILATKTFSITTPGGWNSFTFTTPVSISANVTYRIAVRSSVGQYAASANMFDSTGFSNGNLFTRQSGIAYPDGQDYFNGTYSESLTAYPYLVFANTAYFVDPTFTAGSAGTTANAENATGAGAAQTPASASAGLPDTPAGAGAANTASTTMQAAAEAATGAGASSTSTPTMLVAAENAGATGSAPAATTASGSGDVTATAGSATGAGGAADAASIPVVTAGNATADGSVPVATVTTGGEGGSADGTGSAGQPTATLTPAAESATSDGTANNATVTSGDITVSAGVSAGVGAATDPAAVLMAGAEAATAAGDAQNATAGSPPVTESLFTSQVPDLTNQSDGAPGLVTATAIWFAQAGQITHVRWYCTTTTTGTWTGRIWQVTAGDPGGGTGTVLATATFAGTPTPGWNTIELSSAVTVTPDTALYKVGIHNSEGRYVATTNFAPFVGGGGGVTNGSIRAPFNGDDPVGAGNVYQGSYVYSATADYPNQSGEASNYFVDVVFAPTVVPSTTAPAEPALSDSTASNAAPILSASADHAGAVGTALTGMPSGTTAAAGVAAGSGDALFDPGTTVSVTLISDGPVLGAGSAADAGAAVQVAAGHAAASGIAYQPAFGGAATTAPADNAAAAGTANVATVMVSGAAEAAEATGGAPQPQISTGPVTVSAENAAARAEVSDPATVLAILTVTATADALAYLAGVHTSSAATLSAASGLAAAGQPVRVAAAGLSAASGLTAAGHADRLGNAAAMAAAGELTATAVSTTPPPYVAVAHMIIKTQPTGTVQRTDPVPDSVRAGV